jgi:hypothetical protein
MDIPTYFYAPAATLFGVSVSVCLWIMNQRRKELSYQVLRGDELVNVKGEAKRRVEVRFDGKPVEDAHLVVVCITNTGHLPINPGDYQGKLAICVNPGSSILMADVIETVPGDLDERLPEQNGHKSLIEKIHKERLILQPVLLNEENSLSVQMLVKNYAGKVTVSGHVQGVRAIRQVSERSILPGILTQLGAITMAAAMLFCGPDALLHLQVEAMVPYFLLFLIGYVLLCAGTYLPRKPAHWLPGQ